MSWVVVVSQLAGLVAALVLVLVVVGLAGFGTAEPVVTGAAPQGFAVGWSLLALLSWRRGQPLRWAFVPAVAMAFVGGALLVLAPNTPRAA